MLLIVVVWMILIIEAYSDCYIHVDTQHTVLSLDTSSRWLSRKVTTATLSTVATVTTDLPCMRLVFRLHDHSYFPAAASAHE